MQARLPMEIIYSEDFDSRKGNIFEVTDDFLDYLDRQNTIKISGQFEDDLILPTQQKTYKLRGINLPTSMLILDSHGHIDLQLSNFIKLEDYSHQYHRIYLQIQLVAPQQNDFDSFELFELVQKFGLEDAEVKQAFKISLKEFNRFEEFVNFLYLDNKRLFIPKIIMHKYMRALLSFITEHQLYNKEFTLDDLKEFSPDIKAFNNINQRFFDLVVKKFCFQLANQQQDQKMEIEGQKINLPTYKITFQSIVHFVVIELSTTSTQYKASEMDNLLTKMLNIYTPTGMETPSEEQKKQMIKRITSKYFMETTKNNNLLRIYYDPLEIESTLKGRIKFMSGFKNRFTRDEIKGVFEGLVIQDNSKEIKQLNQGGRKSIDMDDLLLKNFRRFNELYEIKLILPK